MKQEAALRRNVKSGVEESESDCEWHVPWRDDHSDSKLLFLEYLRALRSKMNWNHHNKGFKFDYGQPDDVLKDRIRQIVQEKSSFEAVNLVRKQQWASKIALICPNSQELMENAQVNESAVWMALMPEVEEYMRVFASPFEHEYGTTVSDVVYPQNVLLHLKTTRRDVEEQLGDPDDWVRIVDESNPVLEFDIDGGDADSKLEVCLCGKLALWELC